MAKEKTNKEEIDSLLKQARYCVHSVGRDIKPDHYSNEWPNVGLALAELAAGDVRRTTFLTKWVRDTRKNLVSSCEELDRAERLLDLLYEELEKVWETDGGEKNG